MTEENGAETEVIEADAPEDIGDDISEMLDGLGDEATSMDFWRRAENPPRKWGFLDNLPVEDFSLSLIQERHGGGDYQTRVKKPDGKYMKGTTRTFRISGPPRDYAMPDPEATGDSPDQLATLTELVRDLAVSLRDRHAEPGQGENPMAMALELSKAMREAASEAAQQVRDMLGPDGGGPADPLELVERVLAIQERFSGGGGGGGDGTDAMLNTLGRELITVFRSGKGSGPATGAAPAAGGAPAAAPAPEAPNQPGWVTMLAPTIPNLIGLAVRGRDPFTYARVIQDQLSDRALDSLAYVVAGTGFAEEFYLYFPDTLPHRRWFDDLLGQVRADLAGEEEAGHEIVEVLTEAKAVSEAPEGPGASEPDGGGTGPAAVRDNPPEEGAVA